MLRSRMASYLSRHTIFKATRIRHASTKTRTTDPPGHGENIWVFTHFQTKQVVYSLNRVLNNAAALAQIPFNGKKTVPRALRKDLWLPLAKISFEPGAGSVGLSVFQKLREYRRLHELQWGNEVFLNKDRQPEKAKVRGRKIMNQKANSIADIAAVLRMMGRAQGASIGLKGGFRDSKAEASYIDVEANKAVQHMELHGGRSDKEIEKVKDAIRVKLQKKYAAEKGETDLTRVEVLWKDLADAEFAKSWSKNVTHDMLGVDKRSRVEAVPWTEDVAEPVDEETDGRQGTTKVLESAESQEAAGWESTPIEEQVSREIEQIETQDLSEAGLEAESASPSQELQAESQEVKLTKKQRFDLEKEERDRLNDERLAAHVERQTQSKTEYLLTQGISESKLREEIGLYRDKLLREIAARKEGKPKKAVQPPARPESLKKKKVPAGPAKTVISPEERALRKKRHLQSLLDNLSKKIPIKEQKQRNFIENMVRERARYLAELGQGEEEQKRGVAERKEKLERDYAALRQRQSARDAEKRDLWTAQLEALKQEQGV